MECSTTEGKLRSTQGEFNRDPEASRDFSLENFQPGRKLNGTAIQGPIHKGEDLKN
jgi:hypothetical protein